MSGIKGVNAGEKNWHYKHGITDFVGEVSKMYDELAKRLREIHPEEFSDAWDFAFACQQAMHEAADAIEFLQTYKVCFENMVQIGGWWLVGQDKAIHRMNVPMNWPPKGTKTAEVFPLPPAPKEES